MTARELEQAIAGYQTTALLYTAVRLGLPDALAGTDGTTKALAAHAGCSTDAVTRILRALRAAGVCAEVSPDVHRLTADGELLTSGSDSPHREAVQLAVDQYWPSWAALADAARAEEGSAFELVHGARPFAWRRDHPEAGALFTTWLAKETELVTAVLAESIDVSGAAVVADVGGGTGSLLRAVLTRSDDVSGILIDQPHVVEEAARHWPVELAARTRFAGADFFRTVPGPADCIVLKSVIHDWSDDEAISILRSCCAALSGDGRLLLIERLLDDGDPRTVMLDLHMMAVTGGRERSLEEYRDLLTAAGLTQHQATSTPVGFAIIEARLG
jgi:hypothetical protein